MAVADRVALLRALRVMTENAAQTAMSNKCKLVAPPLSGLKMLDFSEAYIQSKQRNREVCFEGKVVNANICVSRKAGARLVLCLVEPEDGNGFAAFLHIFNALSSSSKPEEAELLFPPDAKIAIKEPLWFSSVVHVSSPASVEFVGVAKQRKFRSVEIMIKEGNRLLEKGSFVLADLYYTECINMFGSSVSCYGDMEKEVFANRAEARRRLGRHEEAVMDAEIALQIDSEAHRFKSLWNKAKSLSSLQEHKLALECLESAADEPDAPAEEIGEELKKCNAFLRQSQHGEYEISIDAFDNKVFTEFSDYMGPVELRMTPDGRGRGMYLTEDVKLGDLLVVSNPIAAVSTASMDGTADANEDMYVELIRNCIVSDRKLDQVCALADEQEMKTVPDMTPFLCNVGKVAPRKQEKRVVDVDRIRRVGDRVAFTHERKDGSFAPGVWGLAGLFNHSCLPNASKLCISNSMFIRAARDLKAGEEVLIGYMEALLKPLAYRQDRTRYLGFECNCRRCSAEKKHQEVLAGFEYEEDEKASVYDMEGKIRKSVIDLENRIKSIPDEEKSWIRAGYVGLYSAAVLFKGAKLPSCADYMKVLHDVAPGNNQTLSKMAILHTLGRCGPESRKLMQEQLTALYGHQSQAVVEGLLKKYRVVPGKLGGL